MKKREKKKASKSMSFVNVICESFSKFTLIIQEQRWHIMPELFKKWNANLHKDRLWKGLKLEDRWLEQVFNKWDSHHLTNLFYWMGEMTSTSFYRWR